MEHPDDSTLSGTPSRSIDHNIPRTTTTQVENGQQNLPNSQPESSGQVSEAAFMDEEKGHITEAAHDPKNRLIQRIVCNFTPSYVDHIFTHF
jgi:hypothetical protein